MATLDFCDLSLIGIIGGTGQFGRAICKRLITSGYHVIVASRKPDSRDLAKRDIVFQDTHICSIEECVTSVKTLILCVRKKHFNTLLPFQSLLSGKIIIDATNQDRRDRNESNTDYLRTMFPGALFCKAFNTMSAYNMSPNEYCQECIKIPVACDNTEVRHAVCEMIRYMGFTPIDYGRLYLARNLEKAPLRVLSGWGGSFIFGVVTFLVWFLHGALLYFIRNNKNSDIDRNFIKVCSKASAMASITLLSATYLAGCFAGFTQIRNGTRRVSFDRWLDKWLRARKSLGLLSMFYALVHVFCTFVIFGPFHYKELYTEFDKPLMWQADIGIFIGILSFIVLGCVAFAAIPSVSETVNWREWRFLQSWMGYGAILLGIAHIAFTCAAFWKKMTYTEVFMTVQFYSIFLPIITVFLKLILICPCVSRHLQDIREGVDRENPKDSIESSDISTGKRSLQSRRRSDVKEKSSTHPEFSVTDETDRPKEKVSREKSREGRERTRDESGMSRERTKEDRRSERGSRSKVRSQQREGKRSRE